MHRYFEPAAGRDLSVLTFLESPERGGGPEQNARNYNRGCYSSTFAVSFSSLCEFEWDLGAIDSYNIFHFPSECASTAPATTLLSFGNPSCCSCAGAYNSHAVDLDGMDYCETHGTSFVNLTRRNIES